MRDADWWKELAFILGDRGKVQFSVDGLEDTNNLYRVNVNWNKVEEAMDVFTQAGGKGRWVYLIFEHNEHQVEEAEQMAKLFGLEFVRKKTGRWVQSYKGKKIDKKVTTKGNEIKPATKPEHQNKSVNKYNRLLVLSDNRERHTNKHLDLHPIENITAGHYFSNQIFWYGGHKNIKNRFVH